MKKWVRICFPVATLIAAVLFVSMPARPALAENISITGRINGYYQLVAEDGTVFEITDTQMGDDLLSHKGSRVQAIGSVAVEDGTKYFDVKSFTVLAD